MFIWIHDGVKIFEICAYYAGNQVTRGNALVGGIMNLLPGAHA